MPMKLVHKWNDKCAEFCPNMKKGKKEPLVMGKTKKPRSFTGANIINYL